MLARFFVAKEGTVLITVVPAKKTSFVDGERPGVVVGVAALIPPDPIRFASHRTSRLAPHSGRNMIMLRVALFVSMAAMELA